MSLCHTVTLMTYQCAGELRRGTVRTNKPDIANFASYSFFGILVVEFMYLQYFKLSPSMGTSI